jgi:hypothetical protein
MKKISITLLLGLACLVFVMNGCKKVNCTELATAVSDAAYAYALDMTKANCEAYYAAIQDWYDGCTVTPAQKAIYDDWLNSANCGK